MTYFAVSLPGLSPEGSKNPMIYKHIFRPLLFRSDPETVHYFTAGLLKKMFHVLPFRALARLRFRFADPILEREVMGIRFPNPVGLAAGFDKDAKVIDELENFGFGFIEIGTVTPLPQDGNPKPRLFRLRDDRALINRMGFNNEGLEAAVSRLKNRKGKVIVGGNIGKNKITPNEEAESDYLKCFEALFPYVDYFTVNISSPNTPNLRALQDKEPLKKLLGLLQEHNQKKAEPKPILLKIAPDLGPEQINDICEIVTEVNLTGIVAANTTISRDGLLTSTNLVGEIGAGGLSGQPLAKRSVQMIRLLRERLPRPFVLIGVGGIFTAQNAIKHLEAGADLVQIYTGFIYEGPSSVKRINKGLQTYFNSKKVV